MNIHRSHFLIEIDKSTGCCRVHCGEADTTSSGEVAVCRGTLIGPDWPSTQELVDRYRRKGTDFPLYLDGEFFVFIWLPKERTYVIASGRLGGVPVLTYEDGTRLIISDHVSGILALGIESEVNPAALLDYFSFFRVLDGATFFKNIRRFPAATVRENRQQTTYWHYRQSGTIREISDAAPLIRDALGSAVERRLRLCHGPVGAHLSGGVDSSVVCLMLQHRLNAPLHTYSIQTAGGKDENPWIDEMTSQLKSRHTRLHPDYQTVIASIADVMEILGEPVGYPSVLSRYFLESAAEEPDIFNGRGVDELFSGYPWHLPPHLDNHMERRRVLTRNEILELFPALRDLAPDHDPERAYMDLYNNICAARPFERSLLLDINLLLRYWLEIEYSLSSAFGRRSHMPVLDREVVDIAARTDGRLKASDTGLKLVFKEAFKDILPPGVLQRPKMGLNMPFSEILRSESGHRVNVGLASLDRHHFPEMDLEAVVNKFAHHRTGLINWGWQFWGILSYISWKQRYVSGTQAMEIE